MLEAIVTPTISFGFIRKYSEGGPRTLLSAILEDMDEADDVIVHFGGQYQYVYGPMLEI